MSLRGASVRIGLWFACFLVVPASSAPAQVIGLVIDDTQAYVARVRQVGYAVWQVTLERGERDDFVRTVSSSDVPTTCPLVRVHESPMGLWLTRDRCFQVFPSYPRLGPFPSFLSVDYPLFDPSRYLGDCMVSEGQPNKRGEILVLSEEDRLKRDEAFRKAFQEGHVRDGLATYHGNQRLLFDFERPSLKEYRESAPTRAFASSALDQNRGAVVLLSEKGVVVYVPYSCEGSVCPTRHEDNAERVVTLPEAERVFLSADQRIGVATASELLVFARQGDAWGKVATEQDFEATACIWDWDTDEFLLVSSDGKEFYRLGSTEPAATRTPARINDPARQQALRDAWAITQLPATRPE